MKLKTRFIVLLLCFTAFAFQSCTEDDFAKYKRMEKKELKTGKRTDDLFFGISLGMTSKQFFAHCWEMNKKGVFTDGNDNTAVLHKLNHNELRHPASMNFYPKFHENKIYKMPVTFQYDAWAPWNQHLSSDSLLTDVLGLYQKWYKNGNPFIRIEDKNKGVIYVKVDGNRRIIIGRHDDMRVKVDYTDLTVNESIPVVN